MTTESSIITHTIDAIVPPDEEAVAAARERQRALTKPQGSLGRLEEIAIWLAGVRREKRPAVKSKAVVIAAADHGVARQSVSAYPQDVTAQMVANFLRGGAAVNALARHTGADVLVIDAGIIEPPALSEGLRSARIGPGTADMTEGPAMSRQQAVSCVETGIQIAHEQHYDAAVLGDMGIGNTTTAAALTAAFTGAPPGEVCGPGTGVDDVGVRRKALVVERALARDRPDPTDPIGVLASVGGFELGVLAGVALGAAARSAAVVLDGYPTTAAALVAAALCPNARDYFLASHQSSERGHRVALGHLGLTPLLDLGLRLGEGTGGLLALGLLEAAARLHDEMATFDQAGVSGPANEGT